MNEDFRHPAPDRTKKAKIYEPHTVDDWKQWLKKQKGAMLTDRALKASDAYIELCKHPKHALVLESALFQIRYKKRERGDNRRTVANGGIVCIPDNLLKVYGINGSDTRAKARVRLVTLGFLDPAESGSLFEATKFVIANRWQHFPNVPPPLNQTPIARRVYPECSLSNPDHPIHRARREKSKPDSINECMPRSLSRNRRGLKGFGQGYGSFLDYLVLRRL